MPILKKEELEKYIGRSLAKSITQAPNAFETAESAASDTVNRTCGLAVPDSADDAPSWAKEAVAHMVLFRLIGTLPSPTQATVTWARQMNEQAQKTLADHKESTPTGRAGAEYSEVEGMLKW